MSYKLKYLITILFLFLNITVFSQYTKKMYGSYSVTKEFTVNDTLTSNYLKIYNKIGAVSKTITLDSLATTLSATNNLMIIHGNKGGNTITTITGAMNGQILILIFVDTYVTITDDNDHAANSVDLSAAFTSADDTVLQLVFDGISWYEVSRSPN